MATVRERTRGTAPAAGTDDLVAWAARSGRPQAGGPAGRVAVRVLRAGVDAIVVGEYERAFYGAQYAAMAPLFEHYGAQLWMPEAGVAPMAA